MFSIQVSPIGILIGMLITDPDHVGYSLVVIYYIRSNFYCISIQYYLNVFYKLIKCKILEQ